LYHAMERMEKRQKEDHQELKEILKGLPSEKEFGLLIDNTVAKQIGKHIRYCTNRIPMKFKLATGGALLTGLAALIDSIARYFTR